MVDASFTADQVAEDTAIGSLPLSHIRVLDLSRSLAGPWACQIFADYGADVIKVERPGTGDEARLWGPPYLMDENGENTGDSVYFLTSNRGKRSITVDMGTKEGQAIIRALAADCDVLVENFKAGDMDRFGLSWKVLGEINPRLIYCSISGFGQEGPRSRQAAYDFAIQAMSGLMSVTGERDDLPGGGPQKVGSPIVDIMTGVYAALGTLIALVQREQTGRGDHVDVALLDCAISGIAPQVMNTMLTGKPPRRLGNRHPTIQPQDRFSCADGDIVLAVGNNLQFSQFCKVIKRDDLITDERFCSNRARTDNADTLLAILRQELAHWPKADLVAALDAMGVPCSSINTIPEILQDPQVIARGVIQQAPHAQAGKVNQIMPPMRLASLGALELRGHPALGAHVDEVLASLGYESGEIKALRERGVI